MYAYPRVCFYGIGEVFDHDLPNEMKNPDEEFNKIKWISTWRRHLALVNYKPFSTTYFINTSPSLKRQWPLNFRIMPSVLQYNVRFFAFSKHSLANPKTHFCDRVEILLLGYHIAKNILQFQQSFRNPSGFLHQWWRLLLFAAWFFLPFKHWFNYTSV